MMIADLLRVAVCTPFLLYSCISDWRTRRVSNKVWIPMLVFAAIFAVYDFSNTGFGSLFKLLLSGGFIFLFVYALFYFGAFGGADAKALIAISLLIPSFPVFKFDSLSFPLGKVPILNFFAFSTFGNAVILTVIVPLGLLLYNLKSLSLSEIREKPLYIFIGYKWRISDLANKHLRLIESIELKNGRVIKKFKRGGVTVDEKMLKQLEDLSKNGKIADKVWVTPGLPFMLSITAGFFAAIIYGDILFAITRALMGM